MKRIRVKFVDYYGMRPDDILAYRILSRHYDVVLDDNHPDYVIDGGLGSEHLEYPNAVKIVLIGENYVPDFNQFDYAVGFDFLTFGDRYLRMPLFAFYSQFKHLPDNPADIADVEKLLRRDFCSFVVSNADGDPARVEFFKKLSKYKPVASGGKLLNNVGGRVADKCAFIAKYKFNIAFENSVVPGYTTEKVMEPLSARSVPIYYGNPRIEEDFNPECMVRVASRADMDRAIEEIVELDKNDDLYLQKLSASQTIHSPDYYERQLEAFLCNIFDQPLEAARRLNEYGYQPKIRKHARRAQMVYDLMHPGKLIKKIKRHLHSA